MLHYMPNADLIARLSRVVAAIVPRKPFVVNSELFEQRIEQVGGGGR